MKKFVVGAIVLALVIGAFFAIPNTQDTAQASGGYAGVAPLTTAWIPTLTRDYPVASAALNVWYRDDYRRRLRTGLPLNDTRIHQDGILHQNWTLDSDEDTAHADVRYLDRRQGTAEFCSTVGVRGSFVLDMTGPASNQLDVFDDIPTGVRVEFASPDNPNVFSATLPTGTNPVATWPVNDYGRTELHFSLTYREIGVYRITFRSIIGGTQRENIYYITVRGWVFGVDYHIWLGWGGQGTTGGLQFTNTGNTVMFDVSARVQPLYGLRPDRKNANSQISVMFRSHQSGELASMNRIGDNYSVCFIDDFFEFDMTQGRQDRIRFNSIEDAPFQNISYVLHFNIRANVPTVGADMHWTGVELRHVDVVRFGTVAFNAPPGRGAGFPWVLFIILILVVLLLGLAIPGLNILIRKTQDTHVRRRNQQRSEKEELDEQNVELLRRQINIENELIKDQEYVDELAEQLLREMREEGKELP